MSLADVIASERGRIEYELNALLLVQKERLFQMSELAKRILELQTELGIMHADIKTMPQPIQDELTHA